MLQLKGLIAAPLTPFNADYSLNPGLIADQINLLHNDGVSGVFSCGTTGETSSLTEQERFTIAEATQEATAGRMAHVVHVGHNALDMARTLAEHAQTIGATAIAAVAPSYFKVTSTSVLVDCCERIAEAAPDTPFYFYHIPSLSGCTVNMPDFLEQAKERIPTLAGIKFTHYDLMEYGLCREIAGGRFDILFGRDEFYLGGLAMGAQGAVGSTYNYMAPLFLEMTRAFTAGDWTAARQAQLTANRIIELLGRYGGIQANKVLLRIHGMDTGPCRLPNRSLTPAEEAAIITAADTIYPALRQPALA